MNHHTLVTFLGKGQYDPVAGYRYRSANYRFPGSEITVTTDLFGLALAYHLGTDEIVVLGTSGSQWGVLMEGLMEETDQDDAQEEEARLELMEAEQNEAVCQDTLDRLTPLMSKAVNKPVVPRLIPSGKDKDDQYQILERIAETVTDGTVSFDLTHGFRHLGMVGFLSAFMLERVGNLHVDSLWYGALDMTGDDGETPVVRLDGLTRVQHWVSALDRFDATGDYGVFAPLLIEDDIPKDKARHLEQAAFHERTMNVWGAVQELKRFLPVLDKQLDGASGLFRKRLRERLRWAREKGLAHHQRKLACEYLERQDFVRAAIFGWEALISMECDRQRLSVRKHDDRHEAKESLQQQVDEKELSKPKRESFRALNALRNGLAHGNPPNNPHHNKILRDRERLYSELKKAFQQLLVK